MHTVKGGWIAFLLHEAILVFCRQLDICIPVDNVNNYRDLCRKGLGLGSRGVGTSLVPRRLGGRSAWDTLFVHARTVPLYLP